MENTPCKWEMDDILTDLEQACIRQSDAEHAAAVALSLHTLRVMLAKMDTVHALLRLHIKEKARRIAVATETDTATAAQAAVRVAAAQAAARCYEADLGRHFLAKEKTEEVVDNMLFAAHDAMEDHWAWMDESHFSYVATAAALEFAEEVKERTCWGQYGPALASLDDAIAAGARAKDTLWARPAAK